MIYLDNAATTPMREECVELLEKYNKELFFNPSALYSEALSAVDAIKTARNKIGGLLGVSGDRIFFNSSASEGDNQVIFCSKKPHGSRIIISDAEHSAVYQSAMEMKIKGYDVVTCPVDSSGKVIVEEYKKLLTKETSLVSIIHVNNVTGAINPIEELVKITKLYNPKILFHSDGVQAFGKIKVNLEKLNVDFYTFSGHKIGAPKGIAGLYVKKGVHIAPLIYGGGQEKGVRSSTENVSGIVCLALAAKLAIDKIAILKEKSNLIFQPIRDLASSTNYIHLITDDNSSPHILALALKGVRGEVMMHSLEKYGILCGIGSACSSKGGIGRIQAALGLTKDYNEGMLRFSISAENNDDDGIKLVDALQKEYEELIKYKRI